MNRVEGATAGMPSRGDGKPMDPDVVHGAVTGISLEREVEREQLSVRDQVLKQDADLRLWVGTRIVWTFIGGNITTLAALAALVCWTRIT
jgi:hypothetical protein